MQSKDRYADACLLHEDESIDPVSPKEALGVSGPPCGSFSQIYDGTAYFYRWGNELVFRFGEAAPIRLSTATTRWSAIGKTAHFVISDDSNIQWEIKYTLTPYVLNIEDDPTAFAEAEDFDFFLFIHSVMSSPPRREQIYR